MRNSMSHNTTTIARFGTGLIQTSIDRVDGHVRWTRVPGINNTRGLRSPISTLSAKAERLAMERCTYVTPRVSSRYEVSWDTSSSTTLASLALTNPDSSLVRKSTARLGAALAAFHQDRSTGWVPPGSTSPAMDRFLGWINGSPIDDARAGKAWLTHLKRTLGPDHFAALRQCGEALQQSEPGVELHGWPTLGSVLVSDEGEVEILAGTDLAFGVPEADISTITGELTEFRNMQSVGGGDPLPYDHLMNIFLEAYGDGFDSARCRRGTIVRIALHSADYATYVGWHDALDTYAELLKNCLINLAS